MIRDVIVNTTAPTNFLNEDLTKEKEDVQKKLEEQQRKKTVLTLANKRIVLKEEMLNNLARSTTNKTEPHESVSSSISSLFFRTSFSNPLSTINWSVFMYSFALGSTIIITNEHFFKISRLVFPQYYIHRDVCKCYNI